MRRVLPVENFLIDSVFPFQLGGEPEEAVGQDVRAGRGRGTPSPGGRPWDPPLPTGLPCLSGDCFTS